jgi:hypothetical protein
VGCLRLVLAQYSTQEASSSFVGWDRSTCVRSTTYEYVLGRTPVGGDSLRKKKGYVRTGTYAYVHGTSLARIRNAPRYCTVRTYIHAYVRTYVQREIEANRHSATALSSVQPFRFFFSSLSVIGIIIFLLSSRQ